VHYLFGLFIYYKHRTQGTQEPQKLLLSSNIQSQVDGRPQCVNGDIAIQWEWSNFDPSQN